MTRRQRHIKITRDGILFFGGLAGILHETISPTEAGERPFLLGVFCTMIGIPAFLSWDENSRTKSKLRAKFNDAQKPSEEDV